MNTFEFIKSKMIELVNEFPQLKVSYQFNKIANVHLVHVLPVEFFKLSENYAEFEVNIMNQFYDLFPDSTITFITDGDLISMSEFPTHIEHGIGHWSQVTFPTAEENLYDTSKYATMGQFNFAKAA